MFVPSSVAHKKILVVDFIQIHPVTVINDSDRMFSCIYRDLNPRCVGVPSIGDNFRDNSGRIAVQVEAEVV